MSDSDYVFRCPNCKQKLKQVTAGTKDDENVTCPHCAHNFNLNEAVEASGHGLARQFEEGLARDLEKLKRR